MLLYSCVWQVEVATAYCGWVHSDTAFTWRLLSHNYVQLKLKIVQFSRLPLPCPSTSKIPPPCWPWMSNFKRKTPPPSSPLQMITNELKEYIIQGWLLYVIRSFFQVSFRFQYQLINLVWLSFDFFSFSWYLTICLFVTLYPCVCSCPKTSRNVFNLQLFTFLVLSLLSACFICRTWKCRQTMEQQPPNACERTKPKQRQN